MSTQSQAEAATAPRDRVVAHLRRQWVGPAGDDSEVLSRSPIYAYLVGILYPSEVGTAQPRAELLEVETGETAVDLESTDPTDPGVEDIDDNDEPAEEDSGLNLTGAFGWAPQSVGMSFIHDGTDVVFSLRAGIYAKSASDKPATVAAVESTPKATQDAADDGSTDSNPPNESWSRQQLLESEVVLPNEANGSIAALGGRATVSWRTRIISNKRLVTVAISNAKTVGVGLAKSDPSQCLFQVELECSIRAGHLQPYPISNPLSTSAEDRELELRYRDKLSYGIGHGTAVTWDTKITEPVTLSTESLPTQEVAAIRPKQGSDRVLDLAWLADETVPTVDLAVALREFAADYSTWLHQQEQTASSFTVARSKKSASDIVDRAKVASARIEDAMAFALSLK